MSDVHTTTSAPPPEPTVAAATTPSPTQQTQQTGNSPEARNPDGSLKDQQTSQPSSTETAKSTTEPKPEAEAKPGEAPVVPEKYDFKVPEGYTVNPDFLDKATPILKELGIPQDGAQKLFDLVQENVTKAQSDIFDVYDRTRSDWRKEIATDKTLGNGKDGLSPAVSANVAAAIASLPAELVPAFKDAMNLTGAGDNPAFVRALNHFGEGLREGRFVPGTKPSPLGQNAPGSAPRSAAQAIFPNLPSASSQS